MSSKLHGLVWEGCAFAGLSLSRVAVMARLADFASDEGISWPAVETIRRQIGAKSINTVTAAIKELERDNWLTKQERKSGNRNLSNVYRINIEKLEQVSYAARKHYRKTASSKITPPIIEGVNIGGPNFEGSNIEKTGSINPPMVDPDPSLNTDPSDKRSYCPDAALPDDDKVSPDSDFISRHPEAAVFSAGKRQWGTAEDLRCAQWIWQKILALYEQAAETDGEVSRPKEPSWTQWANDIRLMRGQDGRTHRQICEMFGRVNRDAFWCRNILSPGKLREQWDKLSLKFTVLPSDRQRGSGTRENLDFSNTNWIDGIEDDLVNAGVLP
ncbi:helix-turn-helix domain-containing protein [Morganella morganii]|uniref:helix-turn-helix domain-containing protein n=1 Tax=Morganella morganii TaxID=582 RepID=UPI001C47E058|nr:helix-turn-helix domain-containing protein [Morganella morganii]QXO56656.1 helix-turn-helix domain-containing protein [Morganella morganii]QXO75615.1 helix-turn-helix domain-containing protein [Morganella morganii]